MGTVIFDVDGTLVDTNYHHAVAWYRAFRRQDVTVPVWIIHRHIGMGGDTLVAAVAGDHVESEHGNDIRAAWSQEFEGMLAEISPLAAASDAVDTVRQAGHTVVLATSGKPEHVEQFLRLVDASERASNVTDSGDVQHSKPAPDLLQHALEQVASDASAEPAVMVGDTVWDCRAGVNAGVPVVAVRSGGFGVDELQEAGAVWVLDSLEDLLARVDDLPFEKGDRA